MLGYFSRSILGLDIGSHSVKLVELKRTREGPIIKCAKTVSIPHEKDRDYTEISRSLGKLLEISDTRSKRVITALSSLEEEQVIMRPIFIPDMNTNVSDDAIRTGIMFEAQEQDYIPYNIDDAQISFDIMGEKTVDGEKGLEIFLVSVHRDLIENQIKLLRDAGLIPFAIDIDILSTARLLGFTNQINDEENIAIIDIGASKTSFCFYENGKPHIYPHISIAGNELTTELSQQLGVSWEKAEKYKRLQVNFDSSDQDKDSSAESDEGSTESKEYTSEEMFHILQLMLEKSEGLWQLQTRLEYYETDFGKLSKIIISGGTSQLASIDEFISSRFSIPVEKISYLEKIPVDAKGDVSDIEDNEPVFATAVGLALREAL